MTPYQRLEKYLDSQAALGALTYEKDAPLSRFCTFKIGGICTYAIFPQSADALCALLDFLRGESKIRTLVFGNGSNVLFCDEGIDGCVIFTTRLKNIGMKDGCIFAESGVTLTELSRFAQKQGLCGMEFLCGIPGNVGGGIYMNAGAYEHSISEVLVRSMYYDRADGKVKELPLEAHDYAHRHSVYMENGGVILGGCFNAEKTDDPDAVKALMEDHLRTRSEKQPLEYPSAGSVFKRYPGYYTSKLIDEAGLKGEYVGGAQVSEKHAGFIINRGGATAKDVLDLVRLVQDKIFENHGIHIECEIRYVK